jgi:hypothetical protein
MGNKSRLKGFMAGENEDNDENAAPIADLFPHCKAKGKSHHPVGEQTCSPFFFSSKRQALSSSPILPDLQ